MTLFRVAADAAAGLRKVLAALCVALRDRAGSEKK
jgi:hypothetical protein